MPVINALRALEGSISVLSDTRHVDKMYGANLPANKSKPTHCYQSCKTGVVAHATQPSHSKHQTVRHPAGQLTKRAPGSGEVLEEARDAVGQRCGAKHQRVPQLCQQCGVVQLRSRDPSR